MFKPSLDIYTPPPNPSSNLSSVLSYVSQRNACQNATCESISPLMDCFAENLEHRILPYSLGRPVLSKEQYAVYMEGIRGFFEWYEMRVREVLECEEGSIVFHATAEGKSTSGTAFTNEYMFTMHFDEDAKITFVKEFVDSNAMVVFFKAVNEHKDKAS